MDTHSDLAFGPPGTGYVMNVVLSRAANKRPDVDGYRAAVELDEANYLLYTPPRPIAFFVLSQYSDKLSDGMYRRFCYFKETGVQFFCIQINSCREND